MLNLHFFTLLGPNYLWKVQDNPPPFSFWILTVLGTSNKSHMGTNEKKYLPIRATVLNTWKGCENLTFIPCKKFSVLRLFAQTKRWIVIDTKLIAILRRQFCVVLTALEENILSVLGSFALRLRPIQNTFLPTSHQRNAELPPQNCNYLTNKKPKPCFVRW